MGQCKFISCNECTIPVVDAENGGENVCVGVYETFLYFPFNFVVNLKVL